MLIGGMLTNAESWINITNKDLDYLEQPDTILERKLFFMYLELGIIPVKFVLMQKIMNFLHYILKEDTDSMVYKVFCALEEDSKREYFIALTNICRKE